MIKRKTIAFNIEDPIQKELYDHVCEYKNFSFYGKNLIQKDMSSKWLEGLEFTESRSIVEEESLEIDNSIAKGFL